MHTRRRCSFWRATRRAGSQPPGGFFGAFVGLLAATQLFNVAAWGVQGDQIVETVRLVKIVGINVVLASLLGGLIVTTRRWVHGGAALLVMGTMLYTLVTGMPTIS